jgi:chromosome segregation ATPase
MTDNPTADEARLSAGDIEGHRNNLLLIAERLVAENEAGRALLLRRAAHALDQLAAALTAIEKTEHVAKLREEAIARDLTAALARAEAAEFNLRSVMKRSDHWQSRAEAAEARIAVLCEEIDMKECVLSALRTRAEAAEKALEPFAKAAEYVTEEFTDFDSVEFALLEWQQPTVGDLRRAASALSGGPVI